MVRFRNVVAVFSVFASPVSAHKMVRITDCVICEEPAQKPLQLHHAAADKAAFNNGKEFYWRLQKDYFTTV